MTWTYANAALNNPRDEVRLLVGDTNSTAQLIQDEDIDYFLSLYPKPAGKPAYLAAAAACDAIAARLARQAQRSLGALSIAAQQQYEHYVQEAERLRVAQATGGRGRRSAYLAVPILGGGGPTTLGSV